MIPTFTLEQQKEWRFPLLVALFFVLLLLIPYGLGYLTVAPDLYFTGILMNPEDTQTYFAKMRQGFDGAWRYTIPFTPDPHQAELVGVFYVWLGQAARAVGLTLIQTWHLVRVLAGLALCIVVYWFVGLFVTAASGYSVQPVSARRLSYLLALFGSGLGWLLFLLGHPYWLDHFPVDFKQPGAHLFFTALTYPHIILGTLLLLLSVGLLQQEVARPAAAMGEKWPRLLLLAVSNLALAIAYPFLIYLVLGTAVITTLYLLVQQRRILWLFGLRLAFSFSLAAPLLLYYAATLYTNPVFRAWDVQAVTPSPPLPHYLVAYGPMLLLAALYAWKRPQEQSRFLLLWAWIATVCLLLYAPLNPQRRFVQGVHVPLSILTTLGFVEVLLPWLWQTRPLQALLHHPRYSRAGMTRLLALAFLGFMSLANGYLWLSVAVSSVIQQPDPLFRPVTEVEAVDWVRQNVENSAVFIGDYQTGNFIPAQAGQRVVLGHWAETVDYEQRTVEVAQFYQSATPDAWRLALIEQYGIDYVWWGPRERELGGFVPETAVYLSPVYQNQTIVIYRVKTTD
jgi:hypothetical protein